MRMASGNLAGRWSSPPTGVDSTCPADTARYPASPAHPTSPTDEPPAGPRRVPRPLRQPDAPRAAGQVQALDARLDMVLAESPGDDADLHADLPLRAADPGRPRRPERSSDICCLASVRAVALDVPGQRADRSDGESDLQREPHTEGVLPEGGARRRDDRHLMSILLQIWFYATPIVYPPVLIASADERTALPLVTLYHLNPMVGFVEAYRDLLYDLRMPPLGEIAYLVGVTVACLVIGYAGFRHWEPRLAEEL